MNKIKTHKMITHIDGEEFSPVKVICIEGQCKKCREKSGNNALIFYDFKTNKANKDDSIVKTKCMVCKTVTPIYLRNIEVIE